MKASELIKTLQMLVEKHGGDPEVLCQTSGCCAHGHELWDADMGVARYDNSPTGDEVGCIVLRAA